MVAHNSDFTYIYEIGKIRGIDFEIAARHTPNTDAVESFAVILWFEEKSGERCHVARIDNTEHKEGEIHLDRFYREYGATIKDFDIDVTDCWEAEQLLVEEWERMARSYLDSHGAEFRNDGRNRG